MPGEPALHTTRGLRGMPGEPLTLGGNISTDGTSPHVLERKCCQPDSSINKPETVDNQLTPAANIGQLDLENIRDDQTVSPASINQQLGPTIDQSLSDITNGQSGTSSTDDQSMGSTDVHHRLDKRIDQSELPTVIDQSVAPNSNLPSTTCNEFDRTVTDNLSLEQLSVMIATGITIPGTDELNVKPLNTEPSKSKMGRHKKPWEK